MRRELRIILVTVLFAGLWTGGNRAAEALVSLQMFRVTEVDVAGTRYLDREDIVAQMGLTAETSVWDDTGSWEERLREHPLVKDAHVVTRIPGTLEVRILERQPVALCPTPVLEPVDADGVRLPLDPADRRLDLPLMAMAGGPAPGSRLLPEQGRKLAAEVGRLMEADTTFLRMVSEVSWPEPGTVIALWSEPGVQFLLEPGTSARRLREGLAVLGDALGRDPERIPTEIDLRYADQVVVRRTR